MDSIVSWPVLLCQSGELMDGMAGGIGDVLDAQSQTVNATQEVSLGFGGDMGVT